jgi:uncharacterized membrane protein
MGAEYTGVAMTFLLAFAIGIIAGLRSLTAPAATCWAAHLGWLDLRQSALAFMGSTLATALFTLFAIGELIADKLPFTPSRLSPAPLAGRILLGGLSGSALCAAAGQSLLVGALLGAVGGIAGALAGYHARRTLTQTMHIPDFVIALIEDAIAIGGALVIVSRS